MIASGLLACAAMVETSDPDRFAATMAAPPDARARLWPLYAYNLELAKAAWASPEPLVCQMRLQWWIDLAEGLGQGGAPLPHEVAAPLSDLVRRTGLPVTLLQDMAEARFRDSSGRPFGDEAELWAYLDRTAGSLMWAAALALGAGAGAEAPLRRFAAGAGLANWFRAAGALAGLGRSPLPDASPEGIAALARRGLDRLSASAQARNALARPARWAMLPGWQAAGLLAQAAAEPDRVADGRLGLSEFRRRGGLLWHALRGGY